MPHAGLFAKFLVELEGILFLQIPRRADAEEREIFDHRRADVGDLGEFLGFFSRPRFFHNPTIPQKDTRLGCRFRASKWPASQLKTRSVNARTRLLAAVPARRRILVLRFISAPTGEEPKGNALFPYDDLHPGHGGSVLENGGVDVLHEEDRDGEHQDF